MGANHARVALGLPGVTLACVVDTTHDRAHELARRTGAQAFTDIDDVLGLVDAAIIAVPSKCHLPVGLACIEAGVGVLVEKPLATNVADARALVAAAETAGVTLMVGHVERFNPAVMELERIVSAPLHFSAVRISPFSARTRDSVVLDLMIHDLDLVRSLVDEPVVHVEALGQTVRTDSVDMASALVRFRNGVTADFTASRIGQHKIRELRVTQRDAFVSVDMIRQNVTIHRVVHSEFSSERGSAYRQSGMVEIPYLENSGEPLYLELREFVRAVAERDRPAVGGRDGVESLELACRVEDAVMAGLAQNG
jgi:predicted dehydrogenase